VHGILRTLPRGFLARVSRFAMEKPA
jgi:hypothetical protein